MGTKRLFIGKRFLITFSVKFTENYTHDNAIYEAGCTYEFQTNSCSDATGDNADDAYNDLHHYFGLIDGTSFVDFLPIENPEILNCKEIAL